MSRQLEAENEDRERVRRDKLVYALEHGLVGVIRSQGMELLGLAIKYSDSGCLLTIKVIAGERRSVAFVGSDTIVNCIVRAYADAYNNRLKWQADKYHRSDA